MFIGNFSWTNEQAWTNEHEQWGEQSCATYAERTFVVVIGRSYIMGVARWKNLVMHPPFNNIAEISGSFSTKLSKKAESWSIFY